MVRSDIQKTGPNEYCHRASAQSGVKRDLAEGVAKMCTTKNENHFSKSSGVE